MKNRSIIVRNLSCKRRTKFEFLNFFTYRIWRMNHTSMELINTNFSSVLAQPVPDLFTVPSFIRSVTAHISYKNSQILCILCSCEPKIQSFSELSVIEFEIFEIIKIVVWLKNSCRKHSKTNRKHLTLLIIFRKTASFLEFLDLFGCQVKYLTILNLRLIVFDAGPWVKIGYSGFAFFGKEDVDWSYVSYSVFCSLDFGVFLLGWTYGIE